MTPVSPASTGGEDKVTYDGHSLDSTLMSPVSPHQQQYQQPDQHDPDANLPEVYVENSPQVVSQHAPPYDHSDKYAMGDDGDTLKHSVHQGPTNLAVEAAGGVSPGAMTASQHDLPTYEPAKSANILGLKRKTFFIILAIILIVIAAAVGGGVGGTLASSSKSDLSSPDDATATPTSTSTSHTPTPIATASDSSVPEPTTQFLNETEPKDTSAFQAWNDDNFEGRFSPIISDIGATNLEFLANSYIWKPSDTACCLSFCNGTSYNGDGVPSWICDERYQKNASESFKRIFVWCGEERINENSRCRER